MSSLLFVLLSSFIIASESYALSSFTLQQSPLLPYDGMKWQLNLNKTNKQIRLFSGQQCNNGCQYTTHAIVYDVTNNIFTTLTPTTDSMEGNGVDSSAVIGDILYFNSFGESEIGTYNLVNHEWILPMNPALPIKVRSACLVSDNKYLYVMGGAANGGRTTNFQIYDSANQVWLTLTAPKLNVERGLSACQIYSGHIYIFGGYPNVDSIETLYVGSNDDVSTNLQSSSWRLLAAKLTGIQYLPATVICDKIDRDLIYIIGGEAANGGSPSASIQIFNMTDESILTASFTLNKKRSAPAVACVDQYIYVFGGTQANTDQSLNDWEISNTLYTVPPTAVPTQNPSHEPSSSPSTSEPTKNPTFFSSIDPSQKPTVEPSKMPSIMPSDPPTNIPSYPPTMTSSAETLIANTDTSASHVTISPGVTEWIHDSHLKNFKTKEYFTIILVIVISAILIVTIILYILWRKRKTLHEISKNNRFQLETKNAMNSDGSNKHVEISRIHNEVSQEDNIQINRMLKEEHIMRQENIGYEGYPQTNGNVQIDEFVIDSEDDHNDTKTEGYKYNNDASIDACKMNNVLAMNIAGNESSSSDGSTDLADNTKQITKRKEGTLTNRSDINQNHTNSGKNHTALIQTDEFVVNGDDETM